MKNLLQAIAVSAAIAAPAGAWQMWDDREIFSSPDGRVQFIELFTLTNNQHALGARELRSVSADGLKTNSFIFNHDVSAASSNKTVLVATPGFRYVPGGVLPDFTNLPAGFLFTGGGSFWLVGGTATQSYGPGVLPLDGERSLDTVGVTTQRASPRNFSGTEGAVLVATPGSGRVYYEGLYHNRPGYDPMTEALPDGALSNRSFLELRPATTSVTFHFLAASPAGDGDVTATVRLFPVGPGGMTEHFAPAQWVTNLFLTETNSFHGAPPAEMPLTNGLLRNPGFETNGVWWTVFNQANYSTNSARSGAFGVSLGDSNLYSGVYPALDLAVRSQRVYRWSAWLRKDTGYTATATWLKIEWKNASTQDISFVDVDIGGSLTTNWQFFSMMATSPAAAALARPVLIVLGAGSGGGFAHADDTAFTLVPPVTQTNRVSLWRAEWVPPRTFTGTVYYAPLLQTWSNGVLRDFHFLIRTIGANAGSTNFGINEYYWPADGQAFGKDYYDLDYSFAWTQSVPFNFNGIYFNSTSGPLPQAEAVPGLSGAKFFDWNAGSNGESHVHMLAPPGAVTAMTVRFDFVAGGGEWYRPGRVVTQVVVDAGAPFHGIPASGTVTLEVWRADFFPPPNWSGQPVYYGIAISTPHDGSTWLVAHLDNAGPGTGVTNDVAPPQYFFTGGPFDRDWSYTPASPVSRPGVRRDYLYHNNTNLNPRTETVPGLPSRTFLDVRYATTTTTFYVMTDHPANVAPGESVEVSIRLDYNHPESGFSATGRYYQMVFDTNLVLDAGAPFHGLPSSGSRTVDVWRLDWTQPLLGGGQPVTNPLTIYYAALLRTHMGAQQYLTDSIWLIGSSTGGVANSFPVHPQIAGSEFFGVDFSYEHLFAAGDDSDGDGLPDAWEMQHFGTLTNAASGDWDGDGWSNLEEYLADTQPTNNASFFPGVSAISMSGSVIRVLLSPSSAARVYDLFTKTNLLDPSAWQPAGLDQPGTGGPVLLQATNSPDLRHFRTGVKIP